VSDSLANPPAALSVAGLTKRYGATTVLQDLQLRVESGAVHGLVGLNGSGKTTTLECILGMRPFDSGEIRVLGHAPDALYRCEGAVVSIFDSPSLHPQLTVRQVLEHAGLLCQHPVRSPAEVEALLGIGKYSGYRIRELSLGNRRRASIAQALLGSPGFVILDEPFNGLDAGGVDDVLNLIARLNREEGTAFLLSSHQLPYLERVCSHLSVLHKGHIAVSGAVSELFDAGDTRLRVRCDDMVRALTLIQDLAGVQVEDTREPGVLTLRIGSGNPALINQTLVSKGILVSELAPERPSLTSLFHAITSADAAAPAAERGAA
jgi:ABC-type multidrug transport system ATPase subunit